MNCTLTVVFLNKVALHSKEVALHSKNNPQAKPRNAESSLLLELLCTRRLLLVIYSGNFADHEDTQMITFKSRRGIVSRLKV